MHSVHMPTEIHTMQTCTQHSTQPLLWELWSRQNHVPISPACLTCDLVTNNTDSWYWCVFSNNHYKLHKLDGKHISAWIKKNKKSILLKFIFILVIKCIELSPKFAYRAITIWKFRFDPEWKICHANNHHQTYIVVMA